jgi:benzoyl-CoA reductase/2-hydroxyglutaryl-CoA dehydratase subunit BcrC/BadD/HgdB
MPNGAPCVGTFCAIAAVEIAMAAARMVACRGEGRRERR